MAIDKTEQLHTSTHSFTSSMTEHSVGQGHAHSKIILMGEHSVVYDYPAIALPFTEARIEAIITPSLKETHTLSSDYYHGTLSEASDTLANVVRGVELTLDSFKLPKDPLHISVQSTIPVGRGMGSSAAVVVAIVRAICNFYHFAINDYQLHFIVNQAEVIAHESTSGIDTLMASSNTPIIYRKSKQPIPFEFKMDAYLIVADSGQEGHTKEAVAKVRRLKESRPEFVQNAMQSIGDFVQQAHEAIKQNDRIELGRLMTYNHYYLNQLAVSNTRLDNIVNAAWIAGALGAKLTGGGLGGCVIALADDASTAQSIEQAMKHAGAVQTWSMPLHGKD